MTLPVFPTQLLAPRQQRISLVQNVIQGGVTVGGVQRVMPTLAGGLWMFEFGDVNLNRKEALKAWRAAEGFLDGGATNIIVPICDCRQAPEGAGGIGDIPHSDDSLFSDDSGYSQGSLSVVTTADAALRATTISVAPEIAALISGGEHFGVTYVDKGRRMHRVVSVDREAGLLTVRPPLRAATPAGTELDFNSPSCTMRLANGDSLAPTVEMGRFASGTIVFVEAF